MIYATRPVGALIRSLYSKYPSKTQEGHPIDIIEDENGREQNSYRIFNRSGIPITPLLKLY